VVKRKADREEVTARLEAIHDMTDDNQMRLEPETEHQGKMDSWIADMKDGRKERTVCQEAMEANPEKMEPIDRLIAIMKQMISMTKGNREKMEAMNLKANLEKIQYE
jgi:hypothetical protein